MQIKKLLRAVGKYLSNPGYRFLIHEWIGCYDYLSDETYLKRKYYAFFGKALNLDNPQTLNEKIQWLKLYDRKPEYTMMVDKYRVREYIAQKIGGEYLIPLLGVWEDPEEIDFDALPDQFVLKCNHNSGYGMCICKDKSKLDIKKVKRGLKKGLKQDYYRTGREWPYKDVHRKIIAEKYIVDEKEKELRDYKFYCFNGRAHCVLVCYDRSINDPKFYFFDRNWKLKRYNKRGLEAPIDFSMDKPDGIDKMFDLADYLSQCVVCAFLRVDLYNANGKIYFGEMTFFPDSGFDTNRLSETDVLFGELVNLPELKQ